MGVQFQGFGITQPDPAGTLVDLGTTEIGDSDPETTR
jgi:hypothetical protein